ncbi:hypothetical protein [Sinorhizobium meliloti]|uniref:hypothetical protein n=1 Tax=Rhizobium meliloti TaxID=382 RepID=UPI000FDB16E5|nr:hypothetical protein [Sinorhizobium meliloti]RVL04738.1 hypothetical protein CN152_04220 [Sinorhizobium meliloti]RVN50631.1 hypothetical protein CN113_04865 [Sinorhizobium meliloti]
MSAKASNFAPQSEASKKASNESFKRFALGPLTELHKDRLEKPAGKPVDDVRIDGILEMIAEGDIIGFKRTSTFGRWGTFAHGEASYDVFVDDSFKVDHDTIRTMVAGHLNTDPHYIRIVAEDMCDGDYPAHVAAVAT